MKKLRGVVMCGGQSLRMGTDKGLIAIENTCWAAFMAAKLNSVALPVSVSVNAGQVEQYRAIFNPDQLIVDSFYVGGPLNGLLSLHSAYPNDDLFLLACDMINMKTETLTNLITVYHNDPGYDFYVYQHKEFAEPFCCIYTGRGLDNLANGAEPSDLANSSLQKVLNGGNTLRLPVTDMESFQNWNTR